jgi:ribosomal protein S18 acetylase RimI-like enzyme
VQKYHPFLSDESKAKTRELMSSTYLQASDISVYEHNGKIVGFVAMVGTYVGVLFVENEHKGKGFAKALLQEVNILDEELVTSAYSDNKVGRAFYERHGFVFVKKEIQDISGEYLIHYHLPKD